MQLVAVHSQIYVSEKRASKGSMPYKEREGAHIELHYFLGAYSYVLDICIPNA